MYISGVELLMLSLLSDRPLCVPQDCNESYASLICDGNNSDDHSSRIRHSETDVLDKLQSPQRAKIICGVLVGLSCQDSKMRDTELSTFLDNSPGSSPSWHWEGENFSTAMSLVLFGSGGN